MGKVQRFHCSLWIDPQGYANQISITNTVHLQMEKVQMIYLSFSYTFTETVA